MQRNQLRTGAILSYVNMALSIIVGLLYTPVMIRLLGASEYGLYNTVASVTAVLSVLNLGFGSAYQRYYSKYKKECSSIKINRLNGLFLMIFSVLGMIAFCCGIFLIHNIELLYDTGLTAGEYRTARILLAVLTVQLTMYFPTCVFTTIVSAHEKYVFAKSLQIMKTLLSPLLTLPLLLLGYKSISLVSVSLFVAVLCDGLNVYYVLSRLKEKFQFGKIDSGLLRELLAYIAFIALHLITDQINWNVDKILLGRFRGTNVVALYSVGYSIYSYMIYLGTPISSLFIPRIHRLSADSDLKIEERKKEYTRIFTSVGRIQFVLIGCIVSGFILFGRPFIELWVGEGYSTAYWVALILMIPGSIDLIQVIGIEIQRSQNLHRFRGIVYIVMAFVNVALSIPLCIHWGAIGSALGTGFSIIVVQGIIINVYLHRKCNVDILFFWKNIFRMSLGMVAPFILGLVAVRCITIETWPSLVACILFYCGIYMISMWIMAFNYEEKELAAFLLNKLLRICKMRKPARDD